MLYGDLEKEIQKGGTILAQVVKDLPVMQETRVGSLDQEDPLEKRMAAHSSILAWRIPRTEEPTVHGVENSQTRLSDLTLSLS